MISWYATVQEAVQSVEPSAAWPTPITERLPSELDADRRGNVQVLTRLGWELVRWSDVADARWQHTPIWTLPEAQGSAHDHLNQLVLAIGCRQPITREIQRLVASVRSGLEVRQ